ncbi:MAG: glycosyltransferase family 2 protein [Sporocytophaga sp.]|uniref:glycosyltransferase family 2 protein n=1 Tax=Sporocytophaga sp. TaxID=2231183 RepID=UPI001B12D396|nr:glycosyltransferase family 2 protein [Sporocytophaga sp.]MBO9703742.1 glycosyltransferase family 2 protein [Sporocytophaga sp.]
MDGITLYAKIIFWIGLIVVFYTYVGYGFVMFFFVKIKRLFNGSTKTSDTNYQPEVSFVVPCFNEAEIIESKIKNSLELDYPKDKLKIIFITDGSNDGTPEIVKQYENVLLLHEDQRGGKSAAENRAMKHVTSPIVIFSDANTILPTQTIKEIVKHYADPLTGAVSGEKRIMSKEAETASSAGEGVYWKYESFLKRMDSEMSTIVGAAGELFSFRKELFTELETDTILDDFMLSMRIAEKGYRVVYEPKAYALETASASVREELKRKVRICAGGWQSMSRLMSAMNPFRNFWLAFQFISHRVLRWSITPILLLLLLPANGLLFFEHYMYQIIFSAQVFFYIAAMVGWYLENRELRVKILFIPYYFFIMNYAVFAGFIRFVKGKQSAAWERSKRGAVIS